MDMVGRALAGLCHATMTEVAPPVAPVVSCTSMSMPKGLIQRLFGRNDDGLASIMLSPVLHDLLFSSTKLASSEPSGVLMISRSAR
jgi:hypothetical protein